MVELVPDQRSEGLRVSDFRATDTGWTITVEGSAGHSYPLYPYGGPIGSVAGAVLADGETPGNVMRVSFEEGAGRKVQTIRIAAPRSATA